MLNFLTGLVGPVSNIATTFLKNKAAVSQAKHEAKMSVIQNDANWDPTIIDRTKQAFQALSELPDWYQALLFICISASFGIKGVDRLINLRKK